MCYSLAEVESCSHESAIADSAWWCAAYLLKNQRHVAIAAHCDMQGRHAPLKWLSGVPATHPAADHPHKGTADKGKSPKAPAPLGTDPDIYWPPGSTTYMSLLGCTLADVEARRQREGVPDDEHLAYANWLDTDLQYLLSGENTAKGRLAPPILDFIGAGPLSELVAQVYPGIGLNAVCSCQASVALYHLQVACYLSTVPVGLPTFCYGALWCVLPVVTLDLFMQKADEVASYLSCLWQLVQLASVYWAELPRTAQETVCLPGWVYVFFIWCFGMSLCPVHPSLPCTMRTRTSPRSTLGCCLVVCSVLDRKLMLARLL